jgi:hypothetical protein
LRERKERERERERRESRPEVGIEMRARMRGWSGTGWGGESLATRSLLGLVVVVVVAERCARGRKEREEDEEEEQRWIAVDRFLVVSSSLSSQICTANDVYNPSRRRSTVRYGLGARIARKIDLFPLLEMFRNGRNEDKEREAEKEGKWADAEGVEERKRRRERVSYWWNRRAEREK